MAAPRRTDAQDRLPNSPPTADAAGGDSDGAPESPPVDQTQAKLDAEAARLAQEAADAAALAEKEAADAQKAAEAAEDHGLPRAARCPHPDCRERLERYTGDNPFKVGTHVCPVHGRIRLR